MTGERVTAPAGRLAGPASDWGVAAGLIGGTLLAYICAGYGVYALVSAIF